MCLSVSVAVSIINYCTAELTINAAASALADLDGIRAKVIIVDNASGDGSADVIQTWVNAQEDDRLIFVKSPTNSGFSGGHNQGMAAVPDADHYLLLNSDAVLRSGFFTSMLDAAQRHPDAGLIAPQLEWESGEVQISCFRFATPTSEIIRGAATGFVTRIFAKHDVSLPHSPPAQDIEWASFACILLRGDMVRKIGPMDEGYFLYFEDAEYGLRAKRAGYSVVYEPAARAVHFRGGSGPVKALQKAKKRLPDYYYRARTRFMRQANGPLGPLTANLLWIGGRAIANLRRLAGRDVPPSHQAEWRDIWMGFFTPLTPDPRSKR